MERLGLVIWRNGIAIIFMTRTGIRAGLIFTIKKLDKYNNITTENP
jgi:hypothetical protein